ncbi:MAG: 30S ribosomal protein S8 [Actinobacteria bacterium]|nr:30S ribosomal protein S8 [Actinomycetota bacterium]
MSSVSDPIADMLTRIRNACTAKLDSTDIPFSKIRAEIARILEEEGFIRSYEIKKDENVQGNIKVYLKYNKNKKSAISGLKRVSKPGLRVYADKENIPVILGGMGIVVLSTSKGVMTGKKARESAMGGEVICSVW